MRPSPQPAGQASPHHRRWVRRENILSRLEQHVDTRIVLFVRMTPGHTLTEELAGEMRVVLYDRAGTGWSDPPPRGRRTTAGLAAELHDLLGAAGIEPPFVLAAHSLGARAWTLPGWLDRRLPQVDIEGGESV